MIKGKNGVTAVVLAMASAPIVLTFVQHKNGGLSQGDDSSATALLEDVKKTVLQGLKKFDSVLHPMRKVKEILERDPRLEKSLPAELRTRLLNSDGQAAKVKALQSNMTSDLADIEKLLGFARLYDQGDDAKVPEGVDLSELDASIDELINNLFPQQTKVPNPIETSPRNGDMVIGCGTPGCEGCGGRKVFEFNENDSYGGKPLFSMGSVEVPTDFHHLADGLPEELKKIFGDNVHIVKIGGQRNTDPLQGLAEALAEAFGSNKK